MFRWRNRDSAPEGVRFPGERRGAEPTQTNGTKRVASGLSIARAFFRQVGDPEQNVASFGRHQSGVSVQTPSTNHPPKGEEMALDASAAELEEAVGDQFLQSVFTGVSNGPEVRRKLCGSVAMASCQVRTKETGDHTTPLLYDGKNGVQVNKRIRVRDQVKSASAPDIKRTLRHLVSQLRPTCAFKVGVTDAPKILASPGVSQRSSSGTQTLRESCVKPSQLTGEIHAVLGEKLALWRLLVAGDLRIGAHGSRAPPSFHSLGRSWSEGMCLDGWGTSSCSSLVHWVSARHGPCG